MSKINVLVVASDNVGGVGFYRSSQPHKKLEELLEKTKVAVRFYTSATPKVKEELSNPQNWKNYIEMNYVNEISAIY